MVGRRLPTLALFPAFIAVLLCPTTRAATLRQAPYCDGQGVAFGLGFEYDCPDRAVNQSVNDANNPADSCEAIQVRVHHPASTHPRPDSPRPDPTLRASSMASRHSTRPTDKITSFDPTDRRPRSTLTFPPFPADSPRALSSRSASTRPRPARRTTFTTPSKSATAPSGRASRTPRSCTRWTTPRVSRTRCRGGAANTATTLTPPHRTSRTSL